MTQEFKIGDVDPYISKIQRMLNELLKINLYFDGNFGPDTRDAVLSCQTQYNLKPTGTYSPGLAALCDPMISEKYLTENAFDKAAALLGVTKAVVKAVQKVESSGYGFLNNGRCTILFERHVFRKRLMAWMKVSVLNLQKVADLLDMNTLPGVTPNTLTVDLVDKVMLIKNPNIYSTDVGGYAGKELEWTRLYAAAAFDPGSAQAATSWGLFQILGLNFGLCGYNSVTQYVSDMNASEQNQLSAFANFIKVDSDMLGALQRRDWRAFSLKYNGAASVNYSTKIQQAVTYFELHP